MTNWVVTPTPVSPQYLAQVSFEIWNGSAVYSFEMILKTKQLVKML